MSHELRVERILLVEIQNNTKVSISGVFVRGGPQSRGYERTESTCIAMRTARGTVGNVSLCAEDCSESRSEKFSLQEKKNIL